MAFFLPLPACWDPYIPCCLSCLLAVLFTLEVPPCCWGTSGGWVAPKEVGAPQAHGAHFTVLRSLGTGSHLLTHPQRWATGLTGSASLRLPRAGQTSGSSGVGHSSRVPSSTLPNGFRARCELALLSPSLNPGSAERGPASSLPQPSGLPYTLWPLPLLGSGKAVDRWIGRLRKGYQG